MMRVVREGGGRGQWSSGRHDGRSNDGFVAGRSGVVICTLNSNCSRPTRILVSRWLLLLQMMMMMMIGLPIERRHRRLLMEAGTIIIDERRQCRRHAGLLLLLLLLEWRRVVVCSRMMMMMTLVMMLLLLMGIGRAEGAKVSSVVLEPPLLLQWLRVGRMHVSTPVIVGAETIVVIETTRRIVGARGAAAAGRRRRRRAGAGHACGRPGAKCTFTGRRRRTSGSGSGRGRVGGRDGTVMMLMVMMMMVMGVTTLMTLVHHIEWLLYAARVAELELTGRLSPELVLVGFAGVAGESAAARLQ